MPNPRSTHHLDPLDLLFVGIVRQAIHDYKHVPAERYEAGVFLHTLGLLNEVGKVAPTDLMGLCHRA